MPRYGCRKQHTSKLSIFSGWVSYLTIPFRSQSQRGRSEQQPLPVLAMYRCQGCRLFQFHWWDLSADGIWWKWHGIGFLALSKSCLSNCCQLMTIRLQIYIYIYTYTYYVHVFHTASSTNILLVQNWQINVTLSKWHQTETKK